MTGVIAFIIGLFFGGTVGFLVASILSASADSSVYIQHGINPNELISWLENHNDNYEYIAPPTTGEIIRKIREMAG